MPNGRILAGMTNRNQAVGAYGERCALRHLIETGLRPVARNWRCPDGEIDIIAWEGEVLAICEVKTRRTEQFGSPAEAVVRAKARRLRRPGRPLARRDRHHRRRGPLRRALRTAAGRRPRPGRAPPGRVLTWATPRCSASAWPAWPGTWSRSRPTSPRACPPCSSPACPTPRCTRPATGSAPPSSTPARNGPTAGSPSTCSPPPCPSTAPRSTSPSPWRSSPAPASCRRSPSTPRSSSANSASTARSVRSAAPCRWSPPPPGPDTRASWCPPATPPRPPSSPAYGCTRSTPCTGSSPTSATAPPC